MRIVAIIVYTCIVLMIIAFVAMATDALIQAINR